MLQDISCDEELKTDSPQHIAVVSKERVVILIEKEIVIETNNIPEVFMMFFALHYFLDLQYRLELKTTMEFFQKVIIKVGVEGIPSKVTSLMEKIAKLRSIQDNIDDCRDY
jgi:hypothetical protein